MNDLDQYRDWLMRNLVGAHQAEARAREAMKDAQTDGAAQDAFTDAHDAWDAAYVTIREIHKALEYLDHYRDWQKVQKLVA